MHIYLHNSIASGLEKSIRKSWLISYVVNFYPPSTEFHKANTRQCELGLNVAYLKQNSATSCLYFMTRNFPVVFFCAVALILGIIKKFQNHFMKNIIRILLLYMFMYANDGTTSN